MAPRPIHHVGLLVSNLEEAIERWTRVMGYTFSPISRYRTSLYSEIGDREPHLHDARTCQSLEGPPHVTLCEFTGTGNHSASQGEGFHHFGFYPSDDLQRDMRAFAGMGIRDEAETRNDDGTLQLFFTDPTDLDGVRLEFFTPPAPMVRDDGSPAFLDANGNPTHWPPK